MSKRGLVDRKNEHLDIVLDPDRAPTTASTGLAEYHFVHCALPELHLDRIDLRTTLLGRPLAAPLLISSMTGGAARAGAINRHLAIAAQQLGIAFAVGSQRVALQDNEASGLTRELRQLAPDIPLLANIGATQLTANGSAWAERAVAMIEADALIIHINALQEAVQPEGDRDWRGVLAAVAELVLRLPVPVVAKEVGAGISAAVAGRLREAGVTIIDVAGSGGTNWALVESARARANPPASTAQPAHARIGHAFADWGIPTAEAIRSVRAALPDTTLIASGGIRDGVDAAKAIRLGADLVGQAAALLAPALQSPAAVVAQLETMVAQLRIACFCTGSADLAALRGAAMTWRGAPLA